MVAFNDISTGLGLYYAFYCVYVRFIFQSEYLIKCGGSLRDYSTVTWHQVFRSNMNSSVLSSKDFLIWYPWRSLRAMISLKGSSCCVYHWRSIALWYNRRSFYYDIIEGAFFSDIIERPHVLEYRWRGMCAMISLKEHVCCDIIEGVCVCCDIIEDARILWYHWRRFVLWYSKSTYGCKNEGARTCAMISLKEHMCCWSSLQWYYWMRIYYFATLYTNKETVLCSNTLQYFLWVHPTTNSNQYLVWFVFFVLMAYQLAWII